MASDTSASPALDKTPAAAENKSRVTKKLPTFRVGFGKQLDALRGYAVLSEQGSKAVHYTKVAELIKAHESNVSSMNPFFLEIGLIEKKDNGYVPHPAVLEYNRAYSWNSETAAQKLAPVIALSWFGQVLGRRLQFRQMSEDEAIEIFAAECAAGPDVRPQLKTLIEYCEAAGIARRENGQLMVGKESADVQEQASPPPNAAKSPIERDDSGHGETSVMTSSGTAAGAVSLQIRINVDLAQLKGWSADRIAAFFDGMAKVVAAHDKGA